MLKVFSKILWVEVKLNQTIFMQIEGPYQPLPGEYQLSLIL